MTLTNIEYGSIASSSVLNGNFSYLDEKITTSNSQINTSISSILSNIATINTRLTEISEDIDAAINTLTSTISDYKTKTKLLVAKSVMVPNWSSCRSITLSTNTSYTAISNGYVLVLPESNGKGNISVNDISVSCKTRENNYDNGAGLISIPVMSGDIVTTTMACKSVYFLPIADITVEDF